MLPLSFILDRTELNTLDEITGLLGPKRKANVRSGGVAVFAQVPSACRVPVSVCLYRGAIGGEEGGGGFKARGKRDSGE